MLLKKTVTGLTLSPIVFYMLVWGHWTLLGLTLFTITGGLVEFYTLLRAKGFNPLFWVGLAIGWLFAILGWLDSGKTIEIVMTIGVIGVLVLQLGLAIWRNVKYTIADLALTLFGSFYIGGLLSYALAYRPLYEEYFADAYPHNALILLPFVGAWAADAGASVAGKFIGKTPLCPAISPNKTIEGGVGGVAGSVVAMIFLCSLLNIPFHHAVLIGLLTSVAGQVGDLAESAFKREMEVKDTGSLISHHGGVLDRADSVLFTIPLTYFYLVLFVVPGMA